MKKRTDNLKKEQAKIHKEFSYLNKVENLALEYALAQANEICDYLNRLTVVPFPSWKAFIYGKIKQGKEEFLYTFYLLENEFGVFEPDNERINKIT